MAARPIAPRLHEERLSRMVTVLGLFPLGAMHALLFAAAWLRFD
jgi:hypothetical protein